MNHCLTASLSSASLTSSRNHAIIHYITPHSYSLLYSPTHLLASRILSLAVEDDSPSLAVATSGGKILLHSPHIGNEAEGNDGEMPHVRFLNFNKKITSLASGNVVMCCVVLCCVVLCCDVLCCVVHCCGGL